jgi:hypothetical protein
VQNREFQITGFQNQPPTLLQTAVNGLKAHYVRKGHCFQETIEWILEKNPRLRKILQRPDSSTDRLYRPDVTHDDKTCCINASSAAASQIPRPPREADDDDPTIHYGVIASANQLIKDAVLRDKLSKEKQVLCFEMEAAGLMNSFPCLVIRGTCDYSDTHKNEAWQGYAALTAAAYAKDLLCRIPRNKVEDEKKIIETLDV